MDSNYPPMPGAPGRGGKGGSAAPVSGACTGADGQGGVGGLAAAAFKFDATPPQNFLAPGQRLVRGQSRMSPSGAVTLMLQTDGNLCVYKSGVAQWCSINGGSGSADTVTMQTDGNFCLSTNGKNTVCSGTEGRPGAYLAVQDGGFAAVYDGTQLVWSAP